MSKILEKSMDGSEIAISMGITRQAVSNILKRAMKKFFLEVKKMDKEWGAFDTSCAMMKMLGVDNNVNDIKKFYMLFPPDIRKEIEDDALENHCSVKTKENYKK